MHPFRMGHNPYRKGLGNVANLTVSGQLGNDLREDEAMSRTHHDKEPGGHKEPRQEGSLDRRQLGCREDGGWGDEERNTNHSFILAASEVQRFCAATPDSNAQRRALPVR